MVWPATAVVNGHGQGRPLLLDEPLSFWGGYDAAAGRIVEAGHPQVGISLAGRVVLMARAKGSSSSSSVLAEAIRNGTGPAAIIMRERDLIVGLGCIVTSELYGLDVPMLVVAASVWELQRAAAGCRLAVPLHVLATLAHDRSHGQEHEVGLGERQGSAPVGRSHPGKLMQHRWAAPYAQTSFKLDGKRMTPHAPQLPARPGCRSADPRGFLSSAPAVAATASAAPACS